MAILMINGQLHYMLILVVVFTCYQSFVLQKTSIMLILQDYIKILVEKLHEYESKRKSFDCHVRKERHSLFGNE